MVSLFPHDVLTVHILSLAGEANVTVRLGVVPVAGGEVRWMDLHCGSGKRPSARSESACPTAAAGSNSSGGGGGGGGGFQGAQQSGEAGSRVGATATATAAAAGAGSVARATGVGVDAMDTDGQMQAGTQGALDRNTDRQVAGSEDENDDEHDDADEYLARVMWLPENGLIVQVQNRAQSRLTLLHLDSTTGQRTVVLEERNPVWINLHDCFTPLHRVTASRASAHNGPKPEGKLPGGFIWASERTGFRHLYLYDGAGECLGPITSGEWMVEAVAGVDESRGSIFFTATADSPLETHLYTTSLYPPQVSASSGRQGAAGGAAAAVGGFPGSASVEVGADTGGNGLSLWGLQGSGLPGASFWSRAKAKGGDSDAVGQPSDAAALRAAAPAWLAAGGVQPPPVRLTQGAGRHLVVLDHRLRRFVDVFDSLDSPPAVRLCSLDSGQVLATVFEQPRLEGAVTRLRLQAPEMVQVPADDGTVLHAAIYR